MSISQGAPRIACYHQKPGEKHETDSPSQPPEGGFQVLKKTQPDDTLISEFWLPEQKINFYCFKPPSDGSHRKPIQQLKPCVSSSRGTELKFAEDHCLSDIDSRPFDSYRICHTKQAAAGAVRLGGNSEEEAPALVGPLLHGRAQRQPSSAAPPPPVQSHHVALTAHPRGCKDDLAVATRK